MEHYITKIQIEKLRHLENIEIELADNSRRHLLITGKNGSGKTSLLEALSKCLRVAVLDPNKDKRKIFESARYLSDATNSGINIDFNLETGLIEAFEAGEFITAYFPAYRKTNIILAHGVEDIKLANNYELSADVAVQLVKYMVHLKTQQAYARQEGDPQVEESIQSWFSRFEAALGVLLEDKSLKLEYDYRNYNFLLHQVGRLPFSFDGLSDGYSSVVQIVCNLIMRMEQNWLLKGTLSDYNVEGIALIDELETHLHIELQKKILPFLVTFFPRVQFIVSTHSPYVLTSISDATVFDLEKKVLFNDMSLYSINDVAEGYFDAENYSSAIMDKLKRYKELLAIVAPTEEERAERAELRMELKNMRGDLANQIQQAEREFENLELRRRHNGQN